MNIMELLVAERDKLTRAIEVLGGARRGRPPGSGLKKVVSEQVAAPPSPKKTRTWSDAQRKAHSKTMKARHAKKIMAAA